MERIRPDWGKPLKRPGGKDASDLLCCALCYNIPHLMASPLGYHYECCGIMGSFPPSKNIEEALKAWNLRAT